MEMFAAIHNQYKMCACPPSCHVTSIWVAETISGLGSYAVIKEYVCVSFKQTKQLTENGRTQNEEGH